jgi:glycerol-3-phosphate acyltransferase PlsY
VGGEVVQNIIAVVIGYLLGSIPFAYIVARLKKRVDIRQLGGGNVGALNVYREVGPAFGLAVLAADVAKGALAVLIARWLALDLIWVGIAGFAAVAGHNWPVFLRFKGGKGAATVMGVLIPLVPIQFAIGLGIAIVVVMITSNIRLGMIGLAFIPLIAWLFDKPSTLIFYSLALFLFLVIHTLVGLRGEMAKAGDNKKSLIFDREYHFWQTKKS